MIGLSGFSAKHPHGLIALPRFPGQDPHGVIGLSGSSAKRPHGLIGLSKSFSGDPQGLIGLSGFSAKDPQGVIGLPRSPAPSPHGVRQTADAFRGAPRAESSVPETADRLPPGRSWKKRFWSPNS